MTEASNIHLYVHETQLYLSACVCNTEYKKQGPYSKERKALIPVMKSAREAGRRVYMVRDKLFIDNKPYVAGATQGDGEECELSIVSWNVEGLKNCLTDIDFVDFVSNFDIIFYSETWQSKRDVYELKEYMCINVPRTESISSRRKSYRGHGGVCLFIKDCIYM